MVGVVSHRVEGLHGEELPGLREVSFSFLLGWCLVLCRERPGALCILFLT